MTTKKGFWDKWNIAITYPFLSALSGFGYFWLSMLMYHNVFFSIFMGMCVSALVNWILIRRKGDD